MESKQPKSQGTRGIRPFQGRHPALTAAAREAAPRLAQRADPPAQAKYPVFVFEDEQSADPLFVERIRCAVNALDFDKDFSPRERELLSRGAQIGFDAALKPLEQSSSQHDYLKFICKAGDLVFARVPATTLREYIPYNDVQFVPDGLRIRVIFSRLEVKSITTGTIYFSRHRPTLVVDGKPRIVAFSRHAIERACDRTDPNWATYAGVADVFAFFAQCTHFEEARLRHNQLAFTFYDACPPMFWRGKYVTEVLGLDTGLSLGNYYYRVGYCPASIADEYIVAKSLLLPGYAKTPEFDLIRRADLPSEEKNRMKELATSETLDHLHKTGDFRLVKWFHDNGVCQLKRLESDPYLAP